MSGTDRLALHDVICMTRIGVTEEERREPQRLAVDLELHADLERAGRSGELRDAIDYRAVCDAVRGHLEAGTFRLVETAARGILDLVLGRFPVARATVRVRKFVLPNVAHVEVEMQRGREDE
jgi:dihydroneopterin aldolase